MLFVLVFAALSGEVMLRKNPTQKEKPFPGRGVTSSVFL